MTISGKQLLTMLGFACAVAVVSSAPAWARANAAHRESAVYLDSAPELGTDTASEPRTRATPVEDFENLARREPAAKYPASARVVFDTQNIFVFIHNAQHGAPIIATQTTK